MNILAFLFFLSVSSLLAHPVPHDVSAEKQTVSATDDSHSFLRRGLAKPNGKLDFDRVSRASDEDLYYEGIYGDGLSNYNDYDNDYDWRSGSPITDYDNDYDWRSGSPITDYDNDYDWRSKAALTD